jgi:hypothetical protein
LIGYVITPKTLLTTAKPSLEYPGISISCVVAKNSALVASKAEDERFNPMLEQDWHCCWRIRGRKSLNKLKLGNKT